MDVVFVEGQSAIGKSYLIECLKKCASVRVNTFDYCPMLGKYVKDMSEVGREMLETLKSSDPYSAMRLVGSKIDRWLYDQLTLEPQHELTVCDRSHLAWVVYRCMWSVPEDKRTSGEKWFTLFTENWVKKYAQAWRTYGGYEYNTLIVLCDDPERLENVTKARDYEVDRGQTSEYHRMQYSAWRWIAHLYDIEWVDISAHGNLLEALKSNDEALEYSKLLAKIKKYV